MLGRDLLVARKATNESMLGAAGARLPACHPRRTLRSAGEMLVLVLERDWSAGASPHSTSW
jgi:hypothetical protein